MEPGVAVDVRNVEHVYAGGVRALAGVSLSIEQGEFVAIIGKNGSGKTTLAKHLNGLLRPTNKDGAVLVRESESDTFSTRDRPLHRIAPVVGYVFQNPDRQIFHDTCREELEYGPRNIGIPAGLLAERVAETLAAVGLPGREETNPVHMSRGERQRLAIAATLVMGPQVAIVDEPTTGQDRHEARLILDYLAQYHASGRTVVAVSHDMALVAEYATRIVAMREGRVLADGPPRQVFARPEVLESTNIRPPQVTVLGARLGHPGLLTVDEAVTALAGGDQ
ncbi:energy-coupling factor ABC transporter ATP-binding protein [Streptomyces sp. S465]|uniref:energy-coupling factor ABC transporter ATP-binding protein n=1 Tax=Streptomyces sp. S465 TaxID=2979468 RepID=UPI0022A81BF1|nr:energy-coupling factor ABC transporter ATP-binding protein [Streptomyces sp. S465]WAP60161.1 energy-coupling factor ABC transporter ATP-binding protein [Streptomyces sp. S465]